MKSLISDPDSVSSSSSSLPRSCSVRSNVFLDSYGKQISYEVVIVMKSILIQNNLSMTACH